MRIAEFEVKNYRSLRSVKFAGLGNLVILIGRNSSGKSNILEALSLFFSNFALAGGNTAGLKSTTGTILGPPSRFPFR